jgi:hypothetical protein
MISGSLPADKYTNLPEMCSGTHTASSSTACCTYDDARPVVESIAKQVVECALEKHGSDYRYDNILDCPTKFKQFKHNICSINGCQLSCSNCVEQGPKANSSLPFTNVLGKTVGYSSTQGLCYGGDAVGVPVATPSLCEKP